MVPKVSEARIAAVFYPEYGSYKFLRKIDIDLRVYTEPITQNTTDK
jgi:hypothetical protein